mmetsp:Transcript_20949/g.30021  ORF Transcript_20949/g.30021 Transcript_20949/m.30021 type:complete len:102 (+) Transcript_20949:1053-1358(+)
MFTTFLLFPFWLPHSDVTLATTAALTACTSADTSVGTKKFIQATSTVSLMNISSVGLQEGVWGESARPSQAKVRSQGLNQTNIWARRGTSSPQWSNSGHPH